MNKIVRADKPVSKIVDGDAKLLPPGTLLEVIAAPDYDQERIGEILIKTDIRQWPFLSLSDGELWGQYAPEYKFERVDYPLLIN